MSAATSTSSATTANPQPLSSDPLGDTLGLSQGDWSLFGPKSQLTAAIFAGVLLAASAASKWSGFSLHLASALAWIALAIGLLYGGKAAIEAARKQWVDIDVLMVVGAILAAVIGAPAEGALLLVLFSAAGALEELAMRRTSKAVESLHALMPTTAQAFDPTSNSWIERKPAELLVGMRIRIPTGEQVPTDAKVLVGTSAMNQASITGESMPRTVRPGDELYAGTINVADPLEAIVTKPADQSSLQRIVELVTQAQAQRQPVQRLIDKLSQPYAITVFAAALIVFFVWHFALGFAAKDAAYTAIALLIVASPCALVIATPTATLAGISRAARSGVLFKGGASIERLARMNAIAFDKTGTLTVGKPSVRTVNSIAWSSQEQVLAVAAALEANSSHPIAQAIVSLANSRGIAPAHATNLRQVTGRGITATVDNHEARLGSFAHVAELLPACFVNFVKDQLAAIQSRGMIAVVCVHNNQAAVFVLADAVRPGADCLVPRLHALGVAPVVMLTGDNKLTAQKVANDLQLDQFYADLLPEHKVQHVHKLKGTDKTVNVGVIGDGVNDAPALAASDVSIAIGSIGSDAALQAADIVMLSDDLATVPWAMGLAKKVRRTMLINLIVATSLMIGLAVAVLVGSVTGHSMPLWLGVVGHEGGTLLVVAHSLLLLAYKPVELCTCDKSAHHADHTDPVSITMHDARPANA